MNALGIRVVTELLRDAIRAVVEKPDRTPGDVYIGPLDDDDAAEKEAVLFLYRVVANADLRSSEHRLRPRVPGGAPVVHRGGLPLDLYYLVTTGTAKARGEEEALENLGRVMQALNDGAILTALPDGEVARVTLEPTSSEEMSRIWTLFPEANYRTSVVYLVSPVWIDPAVVRSDAPPVTDEPHRIGQTPTLASVV